MHTEPALRTAGPIHVAGFVARASYDDASSIGGLWQTFSERAAEAGIAAAPIAVYHDYESDYRGAYSLLIGLPATAETVLPDGWATVEVPRGDYLVFAVPKGPMPDMLIDTWQAIWAHFDEDCAYERAYAFDLELHGAPTEILISVRKRG